MIGLVLLPRGQESGLAPYLLVLAFSILGCGLVWILAGYAFAAAAPQLATRRLINRASGATMLAFAAFFVVSAAYSMLAAHAP